MTSRHFRHLHRQPFWTFLPQAYPPISDHPATDIYYTRPSRLFSFSLPYCAPTPYSIILQNPSLDPPIYLSLYPDSEGPQFRPIPRDRTMTTPQTHRISAWRRQRKCPGGHAAKRVHPQRRRSRSKRKPHQRPARLLPRDLAEPARRKTLLRPDIEPLAAALELMIHRSSLEQPRSAGAGEIDRTVEQGSRHALAAPCCARRSRKPPSCAHPRPARPAAASRRGAGCSTRERRGAGRPAASRRRSRRHRRARRAAALAHALLEQQRAPSPSSGMRCFCGMRKWLHQQP